MTTTLRYVRLLSALVLVGAGTLVARTAAAIEAADFRMCTPCEVESFGGLANSMCFNYNPETQMFTCGWVTGCWWSEVWEEYYITVGCYDDPSPCPNPMPSPDCED